MTRVLILSVLALFGTMSGPALAQAASPFEVAGHVVVANISELDSTDVGISGRVSWFVTPMLGVEAELGFFPSDLPDSTAVSSNRFEGLFGVTAGPRLGAIRPFGRFRPGFVQFGEAPDPIACIAIFPPPLACTLAGGQTLFALDYGGGVDLAVGQHGTIRLDLGDRMIKYPGPAFDRDGEVHDDDFFGHDLRFAIGAGWRF